LAWAFLIEFYFDRSIRRPQDIERGLRIPLFLSIPDFGRNGHNRDVFHETLRDRLIAYFESRGLTHKPKLVAITGVSAKAGVTMTAAGLARSLSETGEGNVLLVDMTQSQGSAQQFNKGKPVCGIDHLLETRNDAQVQDNLFVVGTDEKSEKLSRALPHRFNSLVPKLKASDFDYIIFDMPAVNQISITPRLAQFMDMVLLVVESEHTDRDIAKQAAVLLADSHAHVGAILNKTRNYVPSRAHHEFLGSA
jgi:Mrp family chromosome partitioning ATPase